jgi:hypothetical protein
VARGEKPRFQCAQRRQEPRLAAAQRRQAPRHRHQARRQRGVGRRQARRQRCLVGNQERSSTVQCGQPSVARVAATSSSPFTSDRPPSYQFTRVSAGAADPPLMEPSARQRTGLGMIPLGPRLYVDLLHPQAFRLAEFQQISDGRFVPSSSARESTPRRKPSEFVRTASERAADRFAGRGDSRRQTWPGNARQPAWALRAVGRAHCPRGPMPLCPPPMPLVGMVLVWPMKSVSTTLRWHAQQAGSRLRYLPTPWAEWHSGQSGQRLRPAAVPRDGPARPSSSGEGKTPQKPWHTVCFWCRVRSGI